MRRKTYISLLIVLSFLCVVWLVSGTLDRQRQEFSIPRGANTPIPTTGRVPTLVRLDEPGVVAVSTDGGFEFSRYAVSKTDSVFDPDETTSSWRSSNGTVLFTDPARLWSPAGGEIAPIRIDDMNENTVISCGALQELDGGSVRLVAGTTFEGLWVSDDGGSSWINVTKSESFDFMYRGARFYEQIERCAVDPGSSDIVFSLDFGNGYYRVVLAGAEADVESPQVEQLHLPDLEDAAMLARILDSGALSLSGRASERIATKETVRAAQGRHGIYLSAGAAGRDYLASYVELIRANRYDSIVVDFKDDEGRLTYNTELAKPREIGAVVPRFDATRLIEAAHENGLYLIARVVVFKDKVLYSADDYGYAIWDRRYDRPWGRVIRYDDPETGEQRIIQREHWVDPFSEAVRQYNIDIALELEALGADEIQFDYIRFPSDGPTEHAHYRHGPDSADRVDALAGFLADARRQISIPIGIDVFGFNAWFRTRYLGQDIAVLARHVDVISPMNYPSHFSLGFLPQMTYFERSRHIYDHGSERAQHIVGPGTIIRPYVQAFLIGPELEYEEPEYSQYLIEQLEGTLDSPADGFTLWNASGRYYMVTPRVTEQIAPMLPLRTSEER